MTTKLYGLEKCSTCDKARNWLKRHSIEHSFTDYREQRIDAESLGPAIGWVRKAGEPDIDDLA